MPSREFVDELPDESAAWVQAGLLSPDARDAILHRYEGVRAAAVTRREAGEHTALTLVLYSLAGLLIGAAALAFQFTVLQNTTHSVPLFLIGLGFLGAGALLKWQRPEMLFAEALLVASLVPLTVATPDAAYAHLVRPMVFAAAVTLALSPRFHLPVNFLAVPAYVFAGVTLSALLFPAEEEGMFTLVLALVAVMAAALLAIDRLHLKRDRVALLTFATLGLGGAFAAFAFETLEMRSTGVEMAVGLVMLLVMGAGLLLSHRGPVIGAAAIIAVDAIVFAFDVGGVFTGTISLLLVAGLLIWQAEFLKRYLTAPGSAAP